MVKRESLSIDMKVWVGAPPDLVGDIEFQVPQEVTVLDISPESPSGFWLVQVGLNGLKEWYPLSKVFPTRDAFIYVEGRRLMREVEKATSARVRVLNRFLSHVMGGDGLYIIGFDPSKEEID